MMTPDQVRDDRGARTSGRWVMKHKKPVIPLRPHSTAGHRACCSRRSTSISAMTSPRGLTWLRNFSGNGMLHEEWGAGPDGAANSSLRQPIVEQNRKLRDPPGRPREAKIKHEGTYYNRDHGGALR